MHDIADMDADTQRHFLYLGHPILHSYSATDGVVDRREFDEPAVTQPLYHHPAPTRHLRLKQLLAQQPNRSQSTRLVGAHHARIANHIGGKYGCENDATYQASFAA